MTIWFTSDTHFGHKSIINYARRPFHSVDNMDKLMVMNWNEVVQKGDTVYHLGDISFHNKDKTAKILRSLNGQLHLVRGNHDRESDTWYKQFFASVSPLKEIKVEGQKIVLCHYPMTTWNQAHHGSWHLHGHTHGNLSVSNGKMHDVGVDVNSYVPISFSRVAEIMEGKEFNPVDHHGA